MPSTVSRNAIVLVKVPVNLTCLKTEMFACCHTSSREILNINDKSLKKRDTEKNSQFKILDVKDQTQLKQ